MSLNLLPQITILWLHIPVPLCSRYLILKNLFSSQLLNPTSANLNVFLVSRALGRVPPAQPSASLSHRQRFPIAAHCRASDEHEDEMAFAQVLPPGPQSLSTRQSFTLLLQLLLGQILGAWERRLLCLHRAPCARAGPWQEDGARFIRNELPKTWGRGVVQPSSAARPKELPKRLRVPSIGVGALHRGGCQTGHCEGPGFFFYFLPFVWFLMCFYRSSVSQALTANVSRQEGFIRPPLSSSFSRV